MMGQGDGILGLGILPKPGQLSIAEIVGVRQLVKPDTLQHLIQLDQYLPKGSELVTLTANIQSIRGLLTPETVARLSALANGKQNSDLTINRIQKLTAPDGKIPVYFGGQSLGTGIYDSIVALGQNRIDIMDATSFYKTNKTKLTQLINLDVSGLNAYLNPSLKQYLTVNLAAGQRGLFLDDTQAFRLRLNNLKTQFANQSSGPLLGIVTQSGKLRGYIDSAQSQMKSKFDSFSNRLTELDNVFGTQYYYNGYNFWIGTCNFSDDKPYNDTLVNYIGALRNKISNRLAGAGGGTGCSQGSYYIDAAVTAAAGLRDMLAGLGPSLSKIENMMSESKSFMQTLVGNATLNGASFSNGMLGAMTKQMFEIENQVTNLRTNVENISKEVDSLRNEIQEKLTTKFPLPR
ncbi:MAG: hypothetical protein MUP55_01425 [Candidatus Aenigmarchaeota archaeon]|nr:hypothetical protein [Candidatus Aenigmarchaeota archaeon]